MITTLRPFLLALALLAIPSLASAALDEDNPFGATAPKEVRIEAGGSGEIQVDFGILDHNYFIYRDMSSVEPGSEGGPITVGSGVFPPGKVKFDKVSERDREIFSDGFTVKVPISAAADLADGRYEVVLATRWQGCNKPENYCLFPKSVDLPVTVIVGAGGAAASAAHDSADGATEAPAAADDDDSAAAAEAPDSSSSSSSGTVAAAAGPASENCSGTAGDKGAGATGLVDRALAFIETGESDGGTHPALFFLLLVFLGGIASSFTPCVYPMIPITVSVIGASADQGRMKAFLLSCVYVLGISATYTALGLAASQTGGVFGAALQNHWVLVGVALVMAALAAAMLGAYEFALPSSLTTRASTIGGGGGFVGAFVVGTVAGVVAAPCTGPIVAYLLVEIASHEGWGTLDGALVMFTYSLGLGMLFLLIGTFAGVLASMPRSGTWMVTVKKVFGVVLLGATAYYLAQALDVWSKGAGSADAGWIDPAKQGMWFLVVVSAAWVVSDGAAFLKGNVQPIRFVAALLILGVGGWQIFGPEEHQEAIVWQSDHDATLAAAVTSGKPTIVDFTADWCAACKELEHYTYTDPAVIQCSEDFERIMFDATAETPEFVKLREHYSIKGLPAVFFVCPDGKVIDDLTLKGFEAADRFLEKMNAALMACRAG